MPMIRCIAVYYLLNHNCVGIAYPLSQPLIVIHFPSQTWFIKIPPCFTSKILSKRTLVIRIIM